MEGNIIRTEAGSQTRRRVRNSAVAKAKILKAAEDEFANNGLSGARIDTIALASGYNKSLIYQYFGNKEKLYEVVIYNTYSKLSEVEQVIISKELGYEESVAMIVQCYFEFLKDNPNFVKLIMHENLNQGKYIAASGSLRVKDPMLRALKKVVEAGKSEGVFNESVDETQVLISLITGSFSYFSNIYTLSQVLHIDLSEEENRKKRMKFVTESILNYLRNG
ncbi:MAG: TetR/AcrR family transcriptional regulator [Clostridia bacterium]|nr:TetR/AcrR family transcriptional regulator [Clostridia bacterium]